MLDILPGINSTTAALNAERIRIDVVGQNIANLNTTHGPDGKPYQRQQVVFETLFQQARDSAGAPMQTLTAARIEKDQRPPKLVYEPGHPDANSDGMVAMPHQYGGRNGRSHRRLAHFRGEFGRSEERPQHGDSGAVDWEKKLDRNDQ